MYEAVTLQRFRSAQILRYFSRYHLSDARRWRRVSALLRVLAVECAVVFAANANAASAAATLHTRGDELISIRPYIQYWRSAAPLDAAQLAAIADGRFDALFQSSPTRDWVDRDGEHWLRLTVENDAAANVELVLATDAVNTITAVEAVWFDTSLHHLQTSIGVPIAQRPIPSRYLALPLAIATGSSATLYIKVESVLSDIYIRRMYVTTQQRLHALDLSSAYWVIWPLGFICGMVVSTLIIAAGVKERIGIVYYVGMALSGMLTLLTQSGLLNNLMQRSPYLLLGGSAPAAAIWFAFLLQFIRKLFYTRARYPRLDALCRVAIISGLITVPMQFTADADWILRYAVCFAVIAGTSLITMSIYLTYRRVDQARLLLFAIGAGIGLEIIHSILIALRLVTPNLILGNILLSVPTLVMQLVYSMILAAKVRQYRETNFELATAGAVAHAENRAKSDLLAMMSHEIRTPMNGVLGMVDMLLTTRLDDRQQRFINIIRSSGKTLLTVINDILDFSKLEANKFTLIESNFDLAVLLDEALACYRIDANPAIDLSVAITEDMPLQLRGDPIRLQQIIGNLLSNAFKFTERGAISVQVVALYVGPECVRLRVSVSDTGIGIDAVQQRRLFQPFSQLQHSNRRFGGTGLGLVICQRLVDMMGGVIGVDSELGSGATFYFELMLPRAINTSAAVIAPPTPHRYPDLAVLVAEDNAVNRQVIMAMLQVFGIAADVAHDGVEACGKALEKNYDLILMDCEMPQLDGYGATRQIRRHEAANNTPRSIIVAVSAHVLAEHRQHCLAAGMDDHVAKPVALATLRELLARLEQLRRKQPMQN